MSHPTDTDASRELRSAGKLFAALAAGFMVVSGTSIALAARSSTTAAEALGVAGVPAAEVVTTSTSTTTLASQPSDPEVIEIKMGEFFFAPGALSVPVGTPVTFFVTNPGVVDHELVIGNVHVQDEAEEAMRSGSGHAAHGANDHHADEVPSIYLRPGESGEITATFFTKGELLIGCHVPGHWTAGMRGALRVA